MTQVWVLDDGRIGTSSQLVAVADALAFPFLVKPIRYTSAVKLPDWFRALTLMGITKKSKDNLQQPWPDVVLSGGRFSYAVAHYIRRQSRGKTRVVQLMGPGNYGMKYADLVVLPSHDNYQGNASNVMTVTGTPHRVTSNALAIEKQRWASVLNLYPSKRIALIIGGSAGQKVFTIEIAKELLRKVEKLHAGSLLVTTSRRTPKEVVQFLKAKLPRPCFFYEYEEHTDNPYLGILAFADEIVVTGDSMSMCTEACAVGVPVYIFNPKAIVTGKYRRFHEELFQQGIAVPLGESTVTPRYRLNPAMEIAENIKRLLRDGIKSNSNAK